VEKGGAVWDKLGESQAKDILQELASKATTLRDQKVELLEFLKAHKGEEGTTVSEVNDRVKALKDSVRSIKDTLQKFAYEVDKAAHPVGENLRSAVNSAEIGKMSDLDRVVSDWRQNQPDKAVTDLDSAIKELDLMRACIGCLQDLIAKKVATCDPTNPNESGRKN